MTILLELSDLSIVIMSNDAFTKTVFFLFSQKRDLFSRVNGKENIQTKERDFSFVSFRGLLKRNDIRTIRTYLFCFF